MAAPNGDDRELSALLKTLQDVDRTDREGAFDYAFLEETIFPTLLPALIQLSERVEAKSMPPLPPGEGLPEDPSAFNPLRSLGELLVRQHPSGVFKKETLYSRHLEKLAAARREQRLQRELLVTEAERAQKKAALELALEQTAREEKEAKDREAAHAHELEQKLALRAAERLANAEEKAAGMANVMKLRETCMKIISDFDFSPMQDTRSVSSMIYKETCKMLVTDSSATFVGAGSLDKPGLDATMLHYHTAADKKEFEIEEEEEEPGEEEAEGGEKIEKPPKEPPAPEITTRDLPSPDVEEPPPMVLKRGQGITWTTVVDGAEHTDEDDNVTRDPVKPLYIADAKFTEGMFFFDEKRTGTYLAVPIVKDGEVIGVLCGDTLDSILGSELQQSDAALFEAAAFVMQQCLDYAEWCLLNVRLNHATLSLKSLVKDPRTLPQDFAADFNDFMDLVKPEMHVAVGVFDNDIGMRLVRNRTHEGTMTEDENVAVDDKRELASAMFDAKSKRETWTKSAKEQVVAMAVPVIDANNFVSAVLYVATNPATKAPHEDILTFVQNAAMLALSVLLAPAPSAMRVMSILAAAGIGQPIALYETASKLCLRYLRTDEVFMGCSHGGDSLRVLHQVGSNLGDTIARSEFPAVQDAMRTQSIAGGAGFVAAPLLRKKATGAVSSFGVIAIASGELSGDQQKAFEGVAAALSTALEVSEFRRKLVVCARTALESLLKRSKAIRGVYLSFCDIGGHQVCAAVQGGAVHSSSAGGDDVPTSPGKPVRNSPKIQTQAIQPGGKGPTVGWIGVAAADVEGDDMSMYGDSAWSIMQDVATTLANVSTLLTSEGLMMDMTLPEYAQREKSLLSHFSVVRFNLVTDATMKSVSLKFIDQTKTGKAISPITQRIMSAIMYIFGHQQRDVSDWQKCRKLFNHHMFKEMRMVDVRSGLKVHKLMLAKDCIASLDAGDIATEVGPMPLALWKWILMILDVQGV